MAQIYGYYNARNSTNGLVLEVYSSFVLYATPEGTLPFRYLSEEKSKQENENRNQNSKYLVQTTDCTVNRYNIIILLKRYMMEWNLIRTSDQNSKYYIFNFILQA